MHIERAIELLQAMDVSQVARNATVIVRRTLIRAKKVPQPAIEAQHVAAQQGQRPQAGIQSQDTVAGLTTFDHEASLQLNAGDGVPGSSEEDFEWLNALFDGGQSSSLWTEWIRELESLEHIK